MSRFHALTVADVRQETPDAVSIAFTLPDGIRSEFAFAPGQYLTLRTRQGGEELRRSYSICTSPDDTELRVAIKRVSGGRFSEWAHGGLHAGDTIEVMPPAGRFVLPAGAGGRVYAGFAAGSGITPVIAILRTVLAREPDSRFSLFYGSRSTAHILFREALEDLKDRFMGRLSVFHVLSREQQDVPVLNGHLDAEKVSLLVRTLLPARMIDHAFVCGPAAMIDGITAALQSAGLDPAYIHSERFTTGAAPLSRPTAAPAAAAAAHAVASITVDGLQTEVSMAEGETVLDAALRAGLDLPYSCRGGMCSTCRARVTDGAVTMDVNYGLEPWETTAGFVLTCQARPTTPRVAVDVDAV